jgi:hypothetical protein
MLICTRKTGPSSGYHDVLYPESGSKEQPLLYRSKDGQTVYKQIALRNKKWVYIDGLTIKNLGTEERDCGVLLDGAEHCVIRYCKINATWGGG